MSSAQDREAARIPAPAALEPADPIRRQFVGENGPSPLLSALDTTAGGPASAPIEESLQPVFHVNGNGKVPHFELENGKAPPLSDDVESVDAEAAASSTLHEEVESFFQLAVDELSALRTRAEADAIVRAAELIVECESEGGRVHVTGVGKAGAVAGFAASLLSSTGTAAYFLNPTECLHGSAGQVRKGDLIIAVSNSGLTGELLSSVELLSQLGTKIVGVSGNRESPLAQVSDVFLYAGVDNEGGRLNLAPRASILAETYVLCALSVALETHKELTREQFARWHPGGVLGQRARGDFE